jgi:hypothetical protein
MGCRPNKINQPGSGFRCKSGTRARLTPSPDFSLYPAARQQFFFMELLIQAIRNQAYQVSIRGIFSTQICIRLL